MRVHAHTKPRNVCYFAWLDGKRLTHVIAADDEEGWVVINAIDIHGRLVMDSSYPDGCTPLQLTLHGRVSIVNPALLPVPCNA